MQDSGRHVHSIETTGILKNEKQDLSLHAHLMSTTGTDDRYKTENGKCRQEISERPHTAFSSYQNMTG